MPSPSSMGGMTMISQMYFSAGVFKNPEYHYLDTYYSWGESKFIRFFQSIFQKINFSLSLLIKRIDIVYIMTSSYWGFYDKVIFCMIARLLGEKSVLNPVGGHFDLFYHQNSFNRFMIPLMLRIPNGIISGADYWFSYFKIFFLKNQLNGYS